MCINDRVGVLVALLCDVCVRVCHLTCIFRERIVGRQRVLLYKCVSEAMEIVCTSYNSLFSVFSP